MNPIEKRSEERILLRLGLAFYRRYEHSFHRARARSLLWEAQDGTCIRCGHPMLPRYRFPDHADRDTCDHVWPRALGGADIPGNFALMHSKCNAEKDRKVPTPRERLALRAINLKLGWPDCSPELVDEDVG